MKIVIAFVLLIQFVSYSAWAQKGDGVHFFKGTWDQLTVEAKKTGKPYFIDFWATWCGPCRLLNQTTFKDKAVGEYANDVYIPFKLDTETQDGRMLSEKHNIRSIPTIIFFSSEGKVIGRITGYQNGDAFLESMKRFAPKGSEKKNKKLGSTTTLDEYLEMRKEQIKNLTKVITKEDTTLIGFLNKAEEFGKRKEDLMMDDLKLKFNSAGFNEKKWLPESYYVLAQNDYQAFISIVNPLFESQKLSDNEVLWCAMQYSLSDEQKDNTNLPMRWANHAVRKLNNLPAYEVKASLLLKHNKISDALDVCKAMEKNFKSELDANPSSKAIISIVKAANES